MAVEGRLAELGAGIPEGNGLIGRGRGEEVGVRGELDMVDTVDVSPEGALALGQVEVE